MSNNKLRTCILTCFFKMHMFMSFIPIVGLTGSGSFRITLLAGAEALCSMRYQNATAAVSL